jgi:hypothetical protein
VLTVLLVLLVVVEQYVIPQIIPSVPAAAHAP